MNIRETLIDKGYNENPTKGTYFAPCVAHCMEKTNKTYAKTFYLMENGQVIYERWDMVHLRNNARYGMTIEEVEEYA